jgi:serine/threonine protein kinase
MLEWSIVQLGSSLMVPENTSGGTLPDLIGQSLGRYAILEPLGEGGMATVFIAYDTRLERDVAVKVIRVDQFGSAVLERILKRFEREAKALARLTHPNIVHVNDFGDQDGIPYLVMDYLPGGTLKQQMGKPMPWQDAVKLLLPVADALEYAHSQGIIHRDVKPSNILLTQRGQPMLTDFGIARLLEIEDTQTQTGTGVWGWARPNTWLPSSGSGRLPCNPTFIPWG